MAINFPTSPTAGDVYTYNGRSWVADAAGRWAVSAQTTPVFFSQDTAPTSMAKEGDEWFDTAEGIFYRYIDDGDTFQWVEIGPTVYSAAAAEGYGLAASVGGSALTVSFKHTARADFTRGTAIDFSFRSPTLTTGTPVIRELGAAISLTIPSTATMGATSGKALRLWIVLFDDAGTLRLGAINCLNGINIFPLRDDRVLSSTTVGTGSDSAHVLYSDAGVTSKACRILGYLEWTTLTTAGTWTAPDKLQLLDRGVALPGERVQYVRTNVTTRITGTTLLPYDNTIPQSGEGIEFITQAITPTSAANMLHISGVLNLRNDGTGVRCFALFQDAVANALCATNNTASAHHTTSVPMSHWMLAATASSTTFKARGGNDAAGTTLLNGDPSNAVYGGVVGTFLAVEEIMA